MKRFLGALGDIAAREGDRLLWVLGIDMAHMGAAMAMNSRRCANENEMLAVGARDRQRMERMAAGDATGFWDLVQENHDDLKWCGSSPVYTFLKAVPERARHARALRAVEHRSEERGQLRGYVIHCGLIFRSMFTEGWLSNELSVRVLLDFPFHSALNS